MGTSILTPNEPNPTTGLVVPFIGWHFIGPAVHDILTGCNTIYLASRRAWFPEIKPIVGADAVPPPWQIVFSKPGNESIVVVDTQWFGFDGTFIRVVDQDDVTNNYTVTPK